MKAERISLLLMLPFVTNALVLQNKLIEQQSQLSYQQANVVGYGGANNQSSFDDEDIESKNQSTFSRYKFAADKFQNYSEDVIQYQEHNITLDGDSQSGTHYETIMNEDGEVQGYTLTESDEDGIVIMEVYQDQDSSSIRLAATNLTTEQGGLDLLKQRMDDYNPQDSINNIKQKFEQTLDIFATTNFYGDFDEEKQIKLTKIIPQISLEGTA